MADNITKKNLNDNQKITRTARDYIEGWYNGDKKRMKNALHPDMVKRRLIDGELRELNTKQMVFGTERGGGKNVPGGTYEIVVEILEKSDTIASVVTKSEYIDYLHLAKNNNKWTIINVLWDLNK